MHFSVILTNYSFIYQPLKKVKMDNFLKYIESFFKKGCQKTRFDIVL